MLVPARSTADRVQETGPIDRGPGRAHRAIDAPSLSRSGPLLSPDRYRIAHLGVRIKERPDFFLFVLFRLLSERARRAL